MLEVQKYLKSGKDLNNLKAELGINYKLHDKLPLVILNYDQIDSPKTHAIVRECRGLTLRSDTFELVAKSFDRFFNWGEVQEEMSRFNFNNFVVHAKEDGSLILIYYFDGKWMINTCGSFSQHLMDFQDFTWEQAVCSALRISDVQELDDKLDRSICYVCEFCSPFNKVVRRYPTPVVYLLTAFQREKEIDFNKVDTFCGKLFLRPQGYSFNNIEAIQGFLQTQAKDDPTYEGVVMYDGNYRWKIKSATYLGLHALKGNGDGLFNPKHLLPFILSGEDDELLTYFEEAREPYYKYKAIVDAGYLALEQVFRASQGIQSQKDYALAITGKTPYTGILFALRKKYGIFQEIEHLKNTWAQSPDLILKNLT